MWLWASLIFVGVLGVAVAAGAVVGVLPDRRFAGVSVRARSWHSASGIGITGG